MLKALRICARYGRYGLVFGLVAGLAMPDVATTLKPWLPQMIAGLLFLTAMRIGPKAAAQGLVGIHATLGVVLAFQLVLPLIVLLIASVFGEAQSPYIMAVVLVFAAPALSGSANLAVLAGADPEPAFRLLILGTALLPFTMLPIFWLLPQLGDITTIGLSALRLLLVIFCAAAAGFAVSAYLLPHRDEDDIAALDGAMTLALAVIVIALMAALRPALDQSVADVAIWMTLAFAVNLGMQVITFYALNGYGGGNTTVPFSIVSGNRNVAIFLIALSPEVAAPLLLFLACYQIPMYLTPILMKRAYGAQSH